MLRHETTVTLRCVPSSAAGASKPEPEPADPHAPAHIPLLPSLQVPHLLGALEAELVHLDHEVQSFRGPELSKPHGRDPPALGGVAKLHGQLQILETQADQVDFSAVAGKPGLASLRRRRKAIVEGCGVLLQSLEDLQASMQGDAFPVTPGNTEGATARDDRDAEVRSFLSRRGLEA